MSPLSPFLPMEGGGGWLYITHCNMDMPHYYNPIFIADSCSQDSKNFLLRKKERKFFIQLLRSIILRPYIFASSLVPCFGMAGYIPEWKEKREQKNSS